jgi:hypothetical protein
MSKKKNILDFAPQKDEYTLLQILGLKKKVDKNLVFSMKNVAKKLINS